MNLEHPFNVTRRAVLSAGLPVVRVERPAIDWCGLNTRYMNPGEMETLVALANECHAVTALEIGCNTGRTSRLLIENVETIKRMIGIDVPPGYEFSKTVQRNEVPAQPGHLALHSDFFELRVLKRGSLYLNPKDLPPLDFIFIDGDHGYEAVVSDSKLARDCIKPGGIIAWHDYHDRGNVDVKAVLDAQRAAGHDISLVEGTWIAFERF